MATVMFRQAASGECKKGNRIMKRLASAAGILAVLVLVSGECGGEVEFYISFNLADEDAARSTLLAEAVAEGRKRADVLATAAGASLAGIHTITYEYGRGGGYRYDALCAPSGPSSNPGFSTPDFNPADETIERRVDMQWRLELAE